MRDVQAGATGRTQYFMLYRLDTGAAYTGLAYNSSGLVAYYTRVRAAPVAITLATLASASAAWASGGFIEVAAGTVPGLYRLDVPNAAYAAGADAVDIVISGTVGTVAIRSVGAEVLIRGYDPVAAGSNVTADASGRVTSTETSQVWPTTSGATATVSGATTTGLTLSAAPTGTFPRSVLLRGWNSGGVLVLEEFVTPSAGNTTVPFLTTLAAAPSTVTQAALFSVVTDVPLSSDPTLSGIATSATTAASQATSAATAATSANGKLPSTTAAALAHLDANVSDVAGSTVTSLKGDAEWKQMRAGAMGRFQFFPPSPDPSGAGSATVKLLADDGTTVLATLAVTIDAARNITLSR